MTGHNISSVLCIAVSISNEYHAHAAAITCTLMNDVPQVLSMRKQDLRQALGHKYCCDLDGGYGVHHGVKSVVAVLANKFIRFSSLVQQQGSNLVQVLQTVHSVMSQPPNIVVYMNSTSTRTHRNDLPAPSSFPSPRKVRRMPATRLGILGNGGFSPASSKPR